MLERDPATTHTRRLEIEHACAGVYAPENPRRDLTPLGDALLADAEGLVDYHRHHVMATRLS